MKHNNEDYVSTYPDPGNTTMVRQTGDLFLDAASLHNHVTIPVRYEDGSLHWEDTLPVFEDELEQVRDEGFEALFEEYVEDASETRDYAEYFYDDEV